MFMQEIIDDIESRFELIVRESFYAVAMLIDPRFRGRLLSATDLAVATSLLLDAVNNIGLSSSSAAVADAATVGVSSAQEPATKRARTDLSPLELLMDDLQPSEVAATVAPDDSAVDEISRFLRQPNIAVTQCPLAWWHDHGDDYARIREVARRYLAAPSTSVASERLFSGAGELYSDSRTRMNPDKADMLLFIKYFINHFQQ
jgi:hypothetical protein